MRMTGEPNDNRSKAIPVPSDDKGGAMSDLYHALTCRNCHWCRCEVGMWAMVMICPCCGRRNRLAFASFRPNEWREAETYLETRIPGLYVSEDVDHKPDSGVIFIDNRLSVNNWYVVGKVSCDKTTHAID